LGIVYLPFSGPLIAPLILMIAPLMIINFLLKKTSFNLPLGMLFLLVFIALYSFYLGSFNLENGDEVSILERYKLLPYGLFYQLTNRPALPIFLVFIIGNLWWIKQNQQPSIAKQLLSLSKIMSWFAIIYILILPLGGYREYRPFILRMDTLMPVNFGLFILYGASTLYILNKIIGKSKKIYVGILLIFSLIFLNANRSDFNENGCERNALERIAMTDKNTVKLEEACDVLSWEVIRDPENSRSNARLFERWNLTDTIKLYYYAAPTSK